ncbi:MAG: hypothetical protein WCJ40_20140 [Planctomycetota bacterium]|nr:hypothetical protein [Planctomycetota bacterium]
MATRTAGTNSGSSKQSRSLAMSKPMANLVILGISILLFGRLGISRGWISWPPSHLSAILAAFAGWIALTGPFVLFRYEEQSGGMGLGDRVWITSGLFLWIRHGLELSAGRIPSFESLATAVASKEMAIIAMACLVGGMLTRPKQTHWTWTNLMGWALTLSWITSAAMPSGSSLWPLLALGGR